MKEVDHSAGKTKTVYFVCEVHTRKNFREGHIILKNNLIRHRTDL